MQFLLLRFFFVANSQENQYLFYSGINYGGPLPKESMEKSTGKPLISPNVGFSIRKSVKQNFFIQFDLSYSIKGASYATEYTRDTLIDIGNWNCSFVLYR